MFSRYIGSNKNGFTVGEIEQKNMLMVGCLGVPPDAALLPFPIATSNDSGEDCPDLSKSFGRY